MLTSASWLCVSLVRVSYPALLSAAVPLSSCCCRDPSVCSQTSSSWSSRWPPAHWWHRWLVHADILIAPQPAVCTHRCTSLGLGACKLATSHSLAFNTHKSIDDDDLLVLGRCQTKNNHQIHFHCQMYFALFFSSSHQRPCSPIISSRFDLLESCWLYWSWSAQDFSRKSHHPKMKKWRRKNTFTLYAAPWPSPWCLCWCWRTAWQSCTGQEG